MSRKIDDTDETTGKNSGTKRGRDSLDKHLLDTNFTDVNDFEEEQSDLKRARIGELKETIERDDLFVENTSK